ncbi:probable 2-oxoglutarate-dependent dioxygenase At5g05600 [Oryza brachyantha]|uniref:probable 2-oxoglutarate-dependent dioxygenase At5g05600 n=1 Tax=Oryza brachyantha TaxID=4533 RepID=UPI001AD970AC|nr:probable 2-oxoglutarate-dependent dioxygenase At5g05600 [Oryza brachyantha]
MGGLTMDQAFVQAPEHRPKASVAEADGIPVIDISPLFSAAAGDGGRAGVDALAAEVGRASRDWGFFVVVRHGVPADTVARAAEAQRAFFALPPELRAAVARSEAAPMGYYASEHTKNVRDWKEVFDLVPRQPPPPTAVADGELVFDNKWPDDLPGFREALEEYGEAVEELAFKLLELIARSLGLQPDRLHGFFKDQTTFIRLNHYPPCPSPDLALGVGRHKDAGALTVLYQDHVGGLDVRRRSDGEWVRVTPVPDSFIINVGDIIQVWSNDRYESAEHRVAVNVEKERFSIPFFFNPASYTMVEPLEELVGEESPARYNPYSWGDFFRTRKNSNFKKLDVDNVQIAHFRKT